MKVIMLKDVPRVGQRHDVKDFSDGYAQNVLIVKGLAERATPQALNKLEDMKKADMKRREEEGIAFDIALETINEKHVVIEAPANEKGHLFKSISKKEIADAISKISGITLPVDSIETGIIKEVGQHVIKIQKGNKSGKCNIEVKAKK